MVNNALAATMYIVNLLSLTMKNRITPELITDLAPGEVFVFGSNLAGRHGKGAAKVAMRWGAKYGQAAGLQGQTYAIPTKDKKLHTLTPDEIKLHVDKFIEFAKTHPELTSLVTEVGCGLANYVPADIAPLFADAVNVQNIYLPRRFWEVLEGA